MIFHYFPYPLGLGVSLSSRFWINIHFIWLQRGWTPVGPHFWVHLNLSAGPLFWSDSAFYGYFILLILALPFSILSLMNSNILWSILCPPGPPGAWPPGNKGACCLEMAIIYVHSSESQSPGGKGRGWQENNPIFYFPASVTHAPLTWKQTRKIQWEMVWKAPHQGDKESQSPTVIWRARVPRETQRSPMFPLLIKWNKINCPHQANDSSWLFRAVSL